MNNFIPHIKQIQNKYQIQRTESWVTIRILESELNSYQPRMAYQVNLAWNYMISAFRNTLINNRDLVLRSVHIEYTDFRPLIAPGLVKIHKGSDESLILATKWPL